MLPTPCTSSCEVCLKALRPFLAQAHPCADGRVWAALQRLCAGCVYVCIARHLAGEAKGQTLVVMYASHGSMQCMHMSQVWEHAVHECMFWWVSANTFMPVAALLQWGGLPFSGCFSCSCFTPRSAYLALVQV